MSGVTRRSVTSSLLGLTLVAGASVERAQAENYPNRPVTFVVPLAPGGSTDLIARIVAQALTDALKQQVLVENRGGANGNVGTAAVARSTPDGYTLLVAYSGIQVTNPSIYPKPGWDPIKDFAPVALMGRAPHVIVAKRDLPISNLTELVGYAKENPNKLTFASTGIGALSHIGAEQLMQATGIKMVHVPYRGAGPAMNDLLAGTVDISIVTPTSAMGHLAGGAIKALGMAADRRHPILPNVATTEEQGLPNIDLTAWFALYAPGNTPAPVINRLTAAIEKIVSSDAYKQRLNDQGAYAEYMGPTELAKLTADDLERWGKIIKAANIKIE